jgi:hypothetical protein
VGELLIVAPSLKRSEPPDTTIMLPPEEVVTVPPLMTPPALRFPLDMFARIDGAPVLGIIKVSAFISPKLTLLVKATLVAATIWPFVVL